MEKITREMPRWEKDFMRSLCHNPRPRHSLRGLLKQWFDDLNRAINIKRR